MTTINNDTQKNNIEWITETELSYDTTSALYSNTSSTEESKPCCFHCGESSKPLSKCALCHVASYCSKECQRRDWKKGGQHKYSCPAYKRVGPKMTIANPIDRLTARNDIWHRVRFYACPYAIHKSSTQGLGRGFLFLQSTCTLAQLSLPQPVSSDGRRMAETRSVLLHFLTLGEYDSELCRDDFELACVRDELKRMVEEGGYDETKELVVLMRLRCGHVAVGKVPLVPDYGICVS
eukprot:CAMPEP_0172483932 /NCGR_PEP_ID=MMETSP1066-20121228/11175_1 /TAXON_ID=671091 /ORGANISM="Coscinodiscus wailesii, Strain CCMP2513" /LENGTH=235 /DNA_ID=CAMNT_0013248137 /DNA_START=36 /DNA_END=739 /DNA_ORIENTATION=+